MNRRGFLTALGIGAAAPKQVINETIGSLNLEGLATTALSASRIPGGAIDSDGVGWAQARLAKRALRSFLDIQEERSTFDIHELDVDTASLRSVSLSSKMRISRRLQFEASESRTDRYLKRVIAGLEDY